MISRQAEKFSQIFIYFIKKGDISCTFMAWSKFLLTARGVHQNPRDWTEVSWGTPLKELVGDRRSSQKARRESLMSQKQWQCY